jgi:hypothetical protein
MTTVPREIKKGSGYPPLDCLCDFKKNDKAQLVNDKKVGPKFLPLTRKEIGDIPSDPLQQGK